MWSVPPLLRHREELRCMWETRLCQVHPQEESVRCKVLCQVHPQEESPPRPQPRRVHRGEEQQDRRHGAEELPRVRGVSQGLEPLDSL